MKQILLWNHTIILVWLYGYYTGFYFDIYMQIILIDIYIKSKICVMSSKHTVGWMEFFSSQLDVTIGTWLIPQHIEQWFPTGGILSQLGGN